MLPMTPRPVSRDGDAAPASSVPAANAAVDRCGWSRVDTLSLVNTSPCLGRKAGDERGSEAGNGGGGGGGMDVGSGKRGGVFLTQSPDDEKSDEELDSFLRQVTFQKLFDLPSLSPTTIKRSSGDTKVSLSPEDGSPKESKEGMEGAVARLFRATSTRLSVVDGVAGSFSRVPAERRRLARFFRRRDRERELRFLDLVDERFRAAEGAPVEGVGMTASQPAKLKTATGKKDHLEGPWWRNSEDTNEDDEDDEKAIRLAIEPVNESEEEKEVRVVARVTEHPVDSNDGQKGIRNFFWKPRDAKRPLVGPVLGPAIKEIKDKDLTPLPAKVEFVQICRRMNASRRREDFNTLQVVYATDGAMLTRGKLDVNLPLVDAYRLSEIRLVQPPNTGNDCVGTPVDGSASVGSVGSTRVDSRAGAATAGLNPGGREPTAAAAANTAAAAEKSVKFRADFTIEEAKPNGKDPRQSIDASTNELLQSARKKSALRSAISAERTSAKSVSFRDKIDASSTAAPFAKSSGGPAKGEEKNKFGLKQKDEDIHAWLKEVEETGSNVTSIASLARSRDRATTLSSGDYDSEATEDAVAVEEKPAPSKTKRKVSMREVSSFRQRFPPYRPPVVKPTEYLTDLSVEGKFFRNFEERISAKNESVFSSSSSDDYFAIPESRGVIAAASSSAGAELAAPKPTPASSMRRSPKPTPGLEPYVDEPPAQPRQSGPPPSVADVLVFDTKRLLRPNVETLTLKMQMHDAARGKSMRHNRFALRTDKLFEK